DDFKKDPYGLKIPRFAHIRKVHPRGLTKVIGGKPVNLANNHRLLRRAIGYGKRLPDGATKDDNVPRGLLFLGYQADIEEQFEFIMSGWVNVRAFRELDAGVLSSPGSPGQDAVLGARRDTI